MSTKIYNGYILPALSSYELKQLLDNLRTQLEVAKDELISTKIAEDFIYSFDSIWLGKITEDNFVSEFRSKMHSDFKKSDSISDYERKSLLTNSLFYLQRRQIEEEHYEIWKTNRRNPEYDFQFSVCFMPTEEKIFVTLYAEQKRFQEIWENIEGVEFYPYWDNTDPMEGFTYEEWSERGEEWGRVLNDFNDPPILAGLSWQLLRDQFIYVHGFTVDKIIKYLPSFEKRVKDKAYGMAVKEVHTKLKEKVSQSEHPEDVDKFELYIRAERFIVEEEEGKLLFEACKERVSKLIKPEFSEEDFQLTYLQILELSKQWKEL